MTLPFSSRQAVRKLREHGGFEEAAADAITEVVEDATKELVTKEYFDERLRSAVSEMRAEFYRAIFFLAGFIITVAGASLVAARWLFG